MMSFRWEYRKGREASSLKHGMRMVIFFIFIKCEQSLSKVIENGEQDGPEYHGHIFLDRHAKTRQEIPHDRLGNAIGKQVTDQDVHREAEDGFEVGFPVFEREGLVQEVAQDAAEKIIRGRRNPVAQVEHVVKNEHNRRAKQGVDDADDNEADDGSVQLEFHKVQCRLRNNRFHQGLFFFRACLYPVTIS